MKIFVRLLLVTVVIALVACGNETSDETTTAENSDEGEAYSLNVGVTAGPHEEVMEKVKEVAADNGLDIELTVFTDYVMPNIALDEGDIDANSFQHKPYLDDFKEERNLDIIDVANTVNFPMAIYSEEISDVEQVQDGDKLGLPNDPTNAAHALFVFEEAGLITLKEDAGNTASIKDIEDNPLNLEFIELEAAQIPLHLDEVVAAAINTNYAIENGFTPTEDAIYIESNDSPWVDLIAVRTEDQDSPAVQKLIEAYHSDEVKEFVEEEFQGSLIPTW
ncbi:MAG TPA: MetQ/NlpA family ABC transporter substrate-binding protein [Pseudogracilibacillus sp.]|nr:MetQ/NlpA family ABC transporter substrate-binding protein [Pseudogracilibacillus sp.]